MLKLLKKSEIEKTKVTERQREIEEGMKLAKRVDTLRETASEEEAALHKFRGETLGVIQSEIDAKVLERDTLERENAVMREERIRLSAPIDLTKEWEQVRLDKIDIENWKNTLSEKEVGMLAREGEVTEQESLLQNREYSLAQKESLITRSLAEAEKKFTEAGTTLTEARSQSETLNRSSRNREDAIVLRESGVATKEESFVARETANALHEKDLANRELALRDKYDTLAKAQRFINKN